jgi:hypothetical protein
MSLTRTPKKIKKVEGLDGKAFEEAGKLYIVANFMSDGNSAHGPSASVMKMTNAIEQIFPQKKIHSRRVECTSKVI